MTNIFFNAHHSPVGAFATFTLGFPGASGGAATGIGNPANQNIYIGAEDAPGSFSLLPFFTDEVSKDIERFTPESNVDLPRSVQFRTFEEEDISREFLAGTDTWFAGAITFRIYSPTQAIPNPDSDSVESLRRALVPAVICELTVDNCASSTPRRAFFGLRGTDPYSAMRICDSSFNGNHCGFGQGNHLAVLCDDVRVKSGLGFTMQDMLTASDDNLWFGLGQVGALLMDVPAGESATFIFAVCFYRNGLVTSGIDCSYYYTRLFENIEHVGLFALSNSTALKAASFASNMLLERSNLTDNQKFMLAHAMHSYYGNTQLLDHSGQAIWVVNEGEYRMMNTLDLTVDHLFYELRMNPWVVKNALDLFVDRYSYTDSVRFPQHNDLFDGGISFTHDMGVANVFSRPQFSSYEKAALTDCFSYMSCEQLVNWVCCATTYAGYTSDVDWRHMRMPIFEKCLNSLLNRDNPDPLLRNGVMGLDSSRCAGGAEITTYDALDASLGQARNNVYLAVKTWAAYALLEKLFVEEGRLDLAAIAAKQADQCAGTVARSASEDGYLPAVIGEGVNARIIPAIEGLIFPCFLGYHDLLDPAGRFAELLSVLSKHLMLILERGVCLFDDGGWKLSSTSDNSWLSKIYIAQHVARKVLEVDSENVTSNADSAHVGWLMHKELSYYAWSDQMIAGKAMASRYYPRGVSAILWVD